jgi:lipoprotein-anchoring transpeptidase ErfK/SrfK
MTEPLPNFRQAIRNARDAYETGDYHQARRWASQAARLDPSSDIPWLILGALSKPESAVRYFGEALLRNPQNQHALLGLRRAEKALAEVPQTAEAGLQPAFSQAAPRQQAVSRKQSPLFWFGALSMAAILLAAYLGGFSSLRTIAASAHLLPTEEQPLRLSVRGNPLTPTPTPTFTPTPTPTPTPTSTPTPTPTRTPKPTATKPPAIDTGSQANLPNFSETGEFWIEVDLSSQTLIAHRGDEELKRFAVSTGTWATPTVTGNYQVYVKLTSTTMSGPGYYLPGVPFTMYFYGGYGIHGTYWHNNFGTPMSHGCVNMRTDEAEWVFERSSVGTWVVVHE